jgi:hypothetical protein
MWLLLVVACLLGMSGACVTDEDCSLSGQCVATGCHCNPGWAGENCSFLDRAPLASRERAAVMGYAPNVSSWGGNVVLDPVTGHHHLYASVIGGPNGTSCGLAQWCDRCPKICGALFASSFPANQVTARAVLRP